MEFIRPITVRFYQYRPQCRKEKVNWSDIQNSNLHEYATIQDSKSLDELHQEWNQISFRPRTCCILEDTDKILVGGVFDWDRLEQYFMSGGLSD